MCLYVYMYVCVCMHVYVHLYVFIYVLYMCGVYKYVCTNESVCLYM